MKRLLTLILFLLPFVVFGQLENKDIIEGNEKYNQNDVNGAQQSYQNALQKNPESDAANYNLGNTYYQQKDFQKAAESYQKSAEATDDPTIRSKAYHNLGNSLLEQKKYDESINAYKQALRNNPEDADTKYNLAYAQRMLQQQQQKQQQQNKDDKKDQKKNDQKQQQNKKDENQDQQPQKKEQQQPKQFSKEELDRIMESLNADDKNVQEKINKQKTKSAENVSDKDW